MEISVHCPQLARYDEYHQRREKLFRILKREAKITASEQIVIAPGPGLYRSLPTGLVNEKMCRIVKMRVKC